MTQQVTINGLSDEGSSKVEIQALTGTNVKGESGRSYSRLKTLTMQSTSANFHGDSLYGFTGSVMPPESAWYMPCADFSGAAQAKIRGYRASDGFLYKTFTEAAWDCAQTLYQNGDGALHAGAECTTGDTITLKAPSPVVDVMTFNARMRSKTFARRVQALRVSTKRLVT